MSGRLLPSHRAAILTQLRIALQLLEQTAEDRSCFTCSSLKGTLCREWQAEVPSDERERGCEKWQEKPPF